MPRGYFSEWACVRRFAGPLAAVEGRIDVEANPPCRNATGRGRDRGTSYQRRSGCARRAPAPSARRHGCAATRGGRLPPAAPRPGRDGEGLAAGSGREASLEAGNATRPRELRERRKSERGIIRSEEHTYELQ